MTDNEGRNNLGLPDADPLANKLRVPVNTAFLDDLDQIGSNNAANS